MTEYVVRFLVGGVVVSAFAILGDLLRPRSRPVRSRPDWIHEIKHDGYRLIVQRLRLFTRNGHDWTERYR
jgi:ATP-dependent DNA ligase